MFTLRILLVLIFVSGTFILNIIFNNYRNIKYSRFQDDLVNKQPSHKKKIRAAGDRDIVVCIFVNSRSIIKLLPYKPMVLGFLVLPARFGYTFLCELKSSPFFITPPLTVIIMFLRPVHESGCAIVSDVNLLTRHHQKVITFYLQHASAILKPAGNSYILG
jgi:hypothetical protein